MQILAVKNFERSRNAQAAAMVALLLTPGHHAQHGRTRRERGGNLRSDLQEPRPGAIAW